MVLEPKDDLRKSIPTDDVSWADEVWFTFWIPERKVQGEAQINLRPNLGCTVSTFLLWDDTGEHPAEILYHDQSYHVPVPSDDFTDMSLENGMRFSIEEPGRKYRMRYDAGLGLTADLSFTNIAPEYQCFADQADEEGALIYHVQAVHTEGQITLRGDKIAVDCLSTRDRYWGTMPEAGEGFMGGFTDAHESPEHGFFAFSVDLERNGGTETITDGYLLREGVMAKLKSGTRRVERKNGRVQKAFVDAEDVQGRKLQAEGECVSHFPWMSFPRDLNWTNLTRWSFDGVEVWGEDQDVWTPFTWRWHFQNAGSGS